MRFTLCRPRADMQDASLTVKHKLEQGITTAEILRAAAAPGVLGASAYAAPRILATLYKAGVSAREVAQVIGQEPGMTASVLRVANSPLYGQSRVVSTIDHAVLLLGLDTVRGVAAAWCMRNTLLPGGTSSPLGVSAMLRHSVATAVAAQALARIARPALAAEAFVAGLLHDLGVMVQLRLDPGGVITFIDALREDPTADLTALEEARIGASHARCAAVVFESWKLPALLVSATSHHHDPAAAAGQDGELAALVNLGNHVSLAAGMGFPCEPMAGERNAGATALLALSDDHFERVSAMLPEHVTELQNALA